MSSLVETLRERSRYTYLWLPGFLLSSLRRVGEGPPRHVWLAIADHFEPFGLGADEETARRRVAVWRQRWPAIAARHDDSDGRRPVYTFFYPEEEYRAELLEPLADMTQAGIADVEVHIHHDGEGEANFVERMSTFVETLHGRHGFLRRHEGRLVFGFIHGNWALDNSRPDGRWCGLNNEIALLRDLGCYADFTLPASHSPCQTGLVNGVYRVTDDPLRPRSHARGIRVQPGLPALGDLTLIPGPLGPDFSVRFFPPHIESGELAGRIPVSRGRARLWLRYAPRVGRHAFLKLFAHGAQEQDSGPLLSGVLDRLFSDLASECEAQGAALHYVSTWEMWQVVESLRRREDPHLSAPSRS